MINDKQLAALKPVWKDADHVAGEPHNWVKAGHPHCWVNPVEENGYTVFTDVGYGFLAMFKGDEFIAAGKYQIMTSEVIYNCANYYGLGSSGFYFKNVTE